MQKILGRRRLRAVAAAAAVLTVAFIAMPTVTTHAVASAEPDHTAMLNRGNPKFTWESSGSGVSDPSGLDGR